MRNKFEEAVAKSGLIPSSASYEAIRLPYAIQHTYLPDWIDHGSKTIFETKGFFPPSDRQKMLAVKRQHPGWRIVMILQSPDAKISKRSKTTYRQWCEKNGFVVQTLN